VRGQRVSANAVGRRSRVWRCDTRRAGWAQRLFSLGRSSPPPQSNPSRSTRKKASAWMGIQRRRLSSHAPARVQRQGGVVSVDDERSSRSGNTARWKAPRSSYGPSSATAMDLKAVVLRGTTPADGPRPFRNATSFSKATYARMGDHGVFEIR
jgi:hypothetical protein